MFKIKQFQSVNDLTVDGIIGPQTLNAFRVKFDLSKEQLANFLGQLHVETGAFQYDTESLNYSPNGLMVTFSYYAKRPEEAEADGRGATPANQERIANNVYWDKNRGKAYRLGNKSWGDGWRYRGRGAIMCTGKFNYTDLGNHFGADLIKSPELVATDYFWESAIWFFKRNDLWAIAEKVTTGGIVKLTKSINGGRNGLPDRMRWTRRYLYLQNK